MSLPIVNSPQVVSKLLNDYDGFFTKPQHKNFSRLICGLIVSENKTLQEINDSFGKVNQSSLNRFVSHSKWDLIALNNLRIKQLKKHLTLKKTGTLIIDESLLHKSGHKMELAGIHRSGVTKHLEWGHMVVNCFYTNDDNEDFPVDTQVFVREKDCSKNNLQFKTKRELAIEQIDYSLDNKIPIDLVMADAGYEGADFTKKIVERELNFMIGAKTSTKISINRKKRIAINGYLATLTDKDFQFIEHKNDVYFYNIKKVSIRGLGSLKLVISYVQGDEKNIKCHITNLEENDENIMKLLIKRWRIECFHREAKQHLGFEAYQVRKERGMQVVVLAILIAYTLAILASRIIKIPNRPLKTIGEVCRYLALIAYKGIKWINTKIKNQVDFIKILKKHVFVKNAKV